ncbi:MAG: tail fiber protein [Podoviridae sp. ctda_1]|nr:MAG: tail fiber protein [Podoviridae sp. ctda_1]
MSKLPNHSSRIIESEGLNPFRIEVAPARISFGNIMLNRRSPVHQIVCTNVGQRPVRIGEVKSAGTFEVTHNAPQYLNVGEHFIIDVIFSPRVEGINHGSVYVETNDAAGVEYASLIGYGYVQGSDPEGPGEGGEEGGGVIPKFFTWTGDGVSTQFPLNGANNFQKLVYDVAQEKVPHSKDYLVVNPQDFDISEPAGSAPATIVFQDPPADGAFGFAVSRGYAKPVEGKPPIDTVSPEIKQPEPGKELDNSYQNSLIIVTDSQPTRLEIRRNTPASDKNWKKGDYFSVVQHGTGSVTLDIGTGGTLFPPVEFVAKTRGVDATISATCINPDANQWLLSGDLLRGTLSTERHMIVLEDKTQNNVNSVVARQHAVDGIILPFGFKVDPILDGGLSACVLFPTTSGNILTLDLLRNGVSVLASKITISNGSYSSANATTPPSFIPGGDVFAKGDRLEMWCTLAGSGARGSKIILMGMRQ